MPQSGNRDENSALIKARDLSLQKVPTGLVRRTLQDIERFTTGLPAPVAGSHIVKRRLQAQLPAGYRSISSEIDAESKLPIQIEHEKTGYRLRLIHAGKFLMGSPDGEGVSNEHPQRRIYLDAYWIGETPVTCEQFVRFLNENGNQEEGGRPWTKIDNWINIDQKGDTYRAKEGFNEHPVTSVTWFGACAFARWMQGNLPTEAQWEKAAKGGHEVKWPWGNRWDSNQANTAERIAGVAEFKANEFEMWTESYEIDFSDVTTPVRRYTSNSYGLYDMAGNVWEWCWDWKDDYPSLAVPNPRGPTSGTYRVSRGGCWASHANRCRVASRHYGAPFNAFYFVGFRVALPAGPSAAL